MDSSDKEKDDPEGPVWYTFTFKLPYTLGLTNDGVHDIAFNPEVFIPKGHSAWRNPEAEKAFGQIPVVRMKFFTQPVKGFDIVPESADEVLKAIYGKTVMPEGESWPLYGTDGTAYEQWVSMETPGSRLVWENEKDRGYAFHRCMLALNEFITSYILAFGDTNVQPLLTQDLGAFVFRGAIDSAKEWHKLGPLMMHPDALPVCAPLIDMKIEGKKLEAGVATVMSGHPYIPTKLWYWRALAATRQGDQVDRVISLQTSMESMLFTTWRMLLIDQHKSSAEIDAAMGDETPFKALITNKLHPSLGGRWDTSQESTEVGFYWKHLYQLRGRVVHAGYKPTISEGDNAQKAYKNMRTFINGRLWEKRKLFPRTMFARIGKPEQFGFPVTKATQEVLESLLKEGYSWWLPYDLAGRE